MRLSVCLIVKDEEKNIGECLENVRQFADEIILVDTGSTDQTVKISREYGARIISFEWGYDFSAARNFAFDHASFPWMMWVDADDRFPLVLVDLVNDLKTVQPGNQAHCFKLKNNSPPDSDDFYIMPYASHIRMVPNRDDIRFQGYVHESLLSSLTKINFDLTIHNQEIIHIGYDNKEICIKKIQRNLRYLLYHSGYPLGCNFVEINIGKYFAFYYPNVLTVFKPMGHALEPLCVIDPFKDSKPIDDLNLKISLLYKKINEIIGKEETRIEFDYLNRRITNATGGSYVR